MKNISVTIIGASGSEPFGTFHSLRAAREYVRRQYPIEFVAQGGDADPTPDPDLAIDERGNRGLLPWIVSHRGRRLGMILFAHTDAYATTG